VNRVPEAPSAHGGSSMASLPSVSVAVWSSMMRLPCVSGSRGPESRRRTR
jgi:hypothetical protein